MTFADWCKSTYNLDKFEVLESISVLPSSAKDIQPPYVVTRGSDPSYGMMVLAGAISVIEDSAKYEKVAYFD